MAKVELGEVMAAMDDADPARQFLVDRRTGKVVRVDLADRARLGEIQKALKEDPGRYLQVAKPSSRENFQELEQFAAATTDPRLKQEIARALASPKPFRAFRDLLQARPKDRRDWETFHRRTLEARARSFVKAHGLS